MIRITSKKDGFRRCGIAHSKTPVDHPDDKFNKEQLAILKGDPTLIVVEIPDGPEPGKEDLNKMTNQQLIDEILKIDSEARTNGLNKAALIKMLQGLQAAKEE